MMDSKYQILPTSIIAIFSSKPTPTPTQLLPYLTSATLTSQLKIIAVFSFELKFIFPNLALYKELKPTD